MSAQVVDIPTSSDPAPIQAAPVRRYLDNHSAGACAACPWTEDRGSRTGPSQKPSFGRFRDLIHLWKRPEGRPCPFGTASKRRNASGHPSARPAAHEDPDRLYLRFATAGIPAGASSHPPDGRGYRHQRQTPPISMYRTPSSCTDRHQTAFQPTSSTRRGEEGTRPRSREEIVGMLRRVRHQKGPTSSSTA